MSPKLLGFPFIFWYIYNSKSNKSKKTAMRIHNLLFLFLATMMFVSCQNNNQADDNQDGMTDMQTTPNQQNIESQASTVTVQLEPKSGSNLSGTATFTQSNGQVRLAATIQGLSAGEHAIHIHETGDCSADDGTSAGGHWNPTNQPHGEWGNADGYHKGDIGNFTVDANGVGQVSFTTSEWCIGCNDPQKDIVGKALIIHDGVDDFTSQPSGAAGTRVGCGVIKGGS